MPTPAPLCLVQPLSGSSVDASPSPASIRFGNFELQCDARRLIHDGKPLPLRARALSVLIVLAASPGQLVSRQHLLETAWKGRVVEDGNLSVQINALRQVLGGEAIATVPGYGYRLTLPTISAEASDANPA